jgi:hypothetical protein
MDKRYAGKNKYGMDGLRIQREEECVMEEEIGVLHSGKMV